MPETSGRIETGKPLITFVFGTRPEVIKMAPVTTAFEESGLFRLSLCASGQHREMLHQALAAFGLKADVDLDVMSENQTLAELTSRLLSRLDATFRSEMPAMVVVQGDTTTAMAGALAAFYHQIPVLHVEAGLRTAYRYSPFPEEINRRIIGSIAELHMAPTEAARANLLREGISDSAIAVTGNTAIDALLSTLRRLAPVKLEVRTSNGTVIDEPELSERRLVLVTAHRRENHAEGLSFICEALEKIAQLPDATVVFPVHLNPNVRSIVLPRLAGLPHVHLTEPLDYTVFSRLLDRAFVILTDSGGIQEEAAALGKPVLVLRDNTERQEGISAGNAVLAGTSPDEIVRATTALWTDPALYAGMAGASNPYGDGHAADRILEAACRRLGLQAGQAQS